MATETQDIRSSRDDLIMDISGTVGAAIVDYENGMTLGTIGGFVVAPWLGDLGENCCLCCR